ncbi:dihydrofolate reductase family protein [Leifsonia sp. NPDC058248]|uniref:dihydrofolate reductase family protein n=1 Tax=Leifsonia sp. NPDC058248 TaxID=3346402 RepID=UPI0036DB14AC
MAHTTYYVGASIDGFIADADDRIEWLLQFGFEEFQARYDAFLSGVGALVMGATTYEYIVSVEDREWEYRDFPVWVVTHRTLQPVEGADITFFSGDIAQLDAVLRETAGDRDVWVVGGGAIAAQFADAGLLDEILVTTVPVAIGSGKRLLPVSRATAPMELVSTTPFASGAVEHVYRLARS